MVVNVDGTVTYTPEDGWSGVDSFTYSVFDSVTSTTVTQTVTVTVTPVGGDDVVSTAVATPVDVDIAGNDTCVGCVYGSASVSVPGHGSVVVNVDGTVTYTPEDGWSGVDSFTYSVFDSVTSTTVTQTVTVTVTPVGGDDVVSTAVATPVDVDIAGNDTCVGCVYGSASVSVPGHGSVVVNVDGTVTYTPEDGWSGVDSFTYSVFDSVTSTTVTQTVTVTVTPVGGRDRTVTPHDRTVTINVVENDVCTDCDWTTLTVTDPGHGTAVVNPDRTVTYTPDEGWSGVDSFTYSVFDPVTGTTLTQTVTIVVSPSGTDDGATAVAGEAVTIDVRNNDTCVDCDWSTLTVTQPGHGTAVANADGTVTYTPDRNFSGVDTFSYTVYDPATDTYVTRTVTVAVAPRANGRSLPRQLSFTGSSTFQLGLLGPLLVGAGFGMTTIRKRTRSNVRR